MRRALLLPPSSELNGELALLKQMQTATLRQQYNRVPAQKPAKHKLELSSATVSQAQGHAHYFLLLHGFLLGYDATLPSPKLGED